LADGRKFHCPWKYHIVTFIHVGRVGTTRVLIRVPAIPTIFPHVHGVLEAISQARRAARLRRSRTMFVVFLSAASTQKLGTYPPMGWGCLPPHPRGWEFVACRIRVPVLWRARRCFSVPVSSPSRCLPSHSLSLWPVLLLRQRRALFFRLLLLPLRLLLRPSLPIRIKQIYRCSLLRQFN
jgi:hypothetical protein